MKHFKTNIFVDLRIFIAFVVTSVTMLLSPVEAMAMDDSQPLNPDSIHISLLTCGPHDEIYALYGHTALRYEDRARGVDLAINYGAFSFQTRFFALKFMFGLTDYEMGIMPFQDFCYQYNYFGSSVTQQEFNLTPAEKVKVTQALQENAKPENVVYRYNYYYDNCTTRARDIVCDNIDGKVMFTEKVPDGLTYRKMIHEMNDGHPWAALGNDLLLGVGSDREVTPHDMQFLPHRMHDAAKTAYIVDKQGHKRPLILAETKVLEQRMAEPEPEFPLSPMACGIIIAVLTAAVSFYERRQKKYVWAYDALLLLVQGVCGVILFLMIFSQHPTVRVNLQLLMLSPLALFFGCQAIRHELRRCKSGSGMMHWFWYVNMLCICLAMVLIGFNLQWVDVSVLLLALSLLCRCTDKLKIK